MQSGTSDTISPPVVECGSGHFSPPPALRGSKRFREREKLIGQSVMTNVYYNAALLSRYMYHPTEALPAECQKVCNQLENLEALRLSPWMIFRVPVARLQQCFDYYIGFRGSVTTADWIVNASCVPRKHSNYEDVFVHCGYSAELDHIYDEIVAHLTEAIGNDIKKGFKARYIVACGHSKGGAIAQLFVDTFFLDTRHYSPETKGKKLRSITFATPMVFAGRHPATLPDKVQSASLFTNFVILGDPIPVMQLLMVHNVDTLANIVGIAFNMLEVPKRVESVSTIAGMYYPVGNIFQAELSHPTGTQPNGNLSTLSKFVPVNFTAESGVDKWDCVLATANIIMEHHAIKHYVDIIEREKRAYDEHDRDHQDGVYILNNAPYPVQVAFTRERKEAACFFSLAPKAKTVTVVVLPLSVCHFSEGTQIVQYDVEAVQYIESGWLNGVLRHVDPSSLHQKIRSDGSSIEIIESQLIFGMEGLQLIAHTAPNSPPKTV